MAGTAADSVTNVGHDEHVSGAVVAAVAEAKGVDPLDLEPLFTVVEPDALNDMFRPTAGSPPADLELSFSMAGCQVVVRGGGEVTVTPSEGDERPTTFTPREE